MNNVLKYIRSSIEELLFNKRMNQSSLAKEMGVTPQALNKLMTGDRMPNVSTLIEVAAALKVPVFYLQMPPEDRKTWDGLKAKPIHPPVQVGTSYREQLIAEALILGEDEARIAVQTIRSRSQSTPEERARQGAAMLSQSQRDLSKKAR